MDALEILSDIEKKLIIVENAILDDADGQYDVSETLKDLFIIVENFHSYAKSCSESGGASVVKNNLEKLQAYLQRINCIKEVLEKRKDWFEESFSSKQDVAIAIKNYTDSY